MARKTVNVKQVVESANKILTDSPASSTDIRFGVIGLLEQVLFDSDQYHGFQFVDGNKGHTDDSRRVYYYPQ